MMASSDAECDEMTHSFVLFFPLIYSGRWASYFQTTALRWQSLRTPPSGGPSVLSTDVVVSPHTVIAGERPTRAPLGFN